MSAVDPLHERWGVRGRPTRSNSKLQATPTRLLLGGARVFCRVVLVSQSGGAVLGNMQGGSPSRHMLDPQARYGGRPGG